MDTTSHNHHSQPVMGGCILPVMSRCCTGTPIRTGPDGSPSIFEANRRWRMSPRAGKRHNLIRQIDLCTLSQLGVCSVQGESEMRGIVPSFLGVGTIPKAACVYSLPQI